ncbi:transposase family protein [Bounagaea algeriensis]
MDSSRWSTEGGVSDLRECLAEIRDPRCRRGVRHSLVSILGLAAAAVAAGARSFAAIACWAQEAPEEVLARLDVRRGADGRLQVPDEATTRRVLARVDGDELDTALSRWLASTPGQDDLAGPRVLAVDGKALRGTYPRSGGTGNRLIAALTHDTGAIIAQRDIPRDGNERSAFQPLLTPLDLGGRIVTADAQHATPHQRAQHSPPRRLGRVHRQREQQASLRPARPACLARPAHPHHPRDRHRSPRAGVARRRRDHAAGRRTEQAPRQR